MTNATLVAREDLSDRLSIVRVRPDSGRVPEFEPGQFIMLGLPKTRPGEAPTVRLARPGRMPMTRRAYSVASSPRDTQTAEFFVVLVEQGRLTPRLWDLAVGDRLWMDEQAKGEFTLAGVPVDQDLIMICTGTGIAPFISMLRTYRGQQRWQRFILVCGVRRACDLGYRAELEVLVATDGSVRYIPVVSRPEDAEGWSGLRGRVSLLLDDAVFERVVGGVLAPGRCQVFLCGNPAMVDDMELALERRGFRPHRADHPGDLHVERYW